MTEKKFRLPKDIPLDEYPKPEIYLTEGRYLIEDAQKSGIVLRVMGPIALHYYFPDYVELYRQMERLGERVFTDIDYASYGKYRGKLIPFFEAHGYEIEKRALMISGGNRHIYFGDRVPMIDVFFDKLSYNHPIDYKGRLEINPLCVSLSDLLLQKLQIVQINDKDLKDAMLLFLGAQISNNEQDINGSYLAKIFANDWGFYYTASINLRKIKEEVQNVAVLTPVHKDLIRSKIESLVQIIENVPKSFSWKQRAKVGNKKQWYNDVSDWA